jgi:hypothetical protein
MPGQMITGTDSTIWPLEHPGQLLKKIRLRHEWRDQALQSLEHMGITASSLSPDWMASVVQLPPTCAPNAT